MRVEIIDGWPAYPVALAEAKARLGLEDGFRDADLMAQLASACETVEGRIDLALTRRTYRGWLDAWPCEPRSPWARYIELPFAPAISLTSIKTYDAEGVATVWADGHLFSRSAMGSPGQPPSKGRARLLSGGSWPTVGLEAGGIEIEWVAGYASPGQVPEPIRNAILVLTKHHFDAGDGPEPPAVNNLLRHIRGLRV